MADTSLLTQIGEYTHTHQRPDAAQVGPSSGFSRIMQRLVSRDTRTVASNGICRVDAKEWRSGTFVGQSQVYGIGQGCGRYRWSLGRMSCIWVRD
eukprot:1150028-Pelagomonas_calceolata.AAC.3